MDLLNWILLALSAIVIVSYLFDAMAHHSRIPSVVLLIFCGIAARLMLDYFNVKIPLLDTILPIIGTLGLILIVLEGALDLRVTRENLGLIGRASLCSFLGLLITGALAAGLIHYLFDVNWRQAWLYAVPMAVISSAVAIPAANALAPKLREFVIYESSLSDIMGVLLFYALLEGEGNFGTRAITSFGTVLISLGVGFLSALLLYWLISRIEAHVRFVPMIAGVALLYAAGKLMHLAPLVIVMVVGLMLNNMGLFQPLPFVKTILSYNFRDELDTFKHLVAEATFVVRTFFFVLLGYSTLITDLLHPDVWLVALGLFACYLVPRMGLIYTLAGNRKLEPLLWFGPKGLITVLLILSLPESEIIESFPQSAVMLLILLSALLLAFGNLRYGQQQAKNDTQLQEIPEQIPTESTSLQQPASMKEG